MYNINQRFLQDLFIKKNVLINNKLYSDLYEQIWPCEELFINFLTFTDPTLKLEYAKKIYSFIQSNNDIFLPLSMVDNIIEFQNSNLVDNINGYVPQDHVVHCVNLYITGIYIFFNNEIFNSKLIRDINSNVSLIKRYKEFIDKWLLFSFYHDIGYYLEGSVNKNGCYDSNYKEVIKYYESGAINEIVYLCTTRIITRLIMIASVLSNNGKRFLNNDIKNIEFTDDKLDDLKLLKDYENATLVNGVHIFEECCVLQNIFNQTKSITISYNSNHELVCIALREFGKIKHFFINKRFSNLFSGNSTKIENCIQTVKDLPCNHYILNPNKVFQKYGDTLFQELAIDFFERLPKDLKEEFIFMPSAKELKMYYNHTNEWIISKLKFDYLTKTTSYINEDLRSTCYKNVFISTISKAMEEIFEKYKTDKNLFDDINKLIEKILKDLDKQVLEENVHTEANLEYEKKHGAFVDIVDFGIIAYKELYHHVYEIKDNKKWMKSISFIEKVGHEKLRINPFSHNEKDEGSVDKKIYDKLQEMSIKMGINLYELQKYSTPYTACDHGVISAAILYQAIVTFFKINEGCIKNRKFDIIWGCCDDEAFSNNEENVNKYADVIFAVLLHNIYTKSSVPYGIDYKHDIDKNPFSYFGAYCDTIQKWNRSKQIDLSKTYLPDVNYLNDLFDIEIKNNKIYIKCFYSDLSQMNKTIADSEVFLPGITRITKVIGIKD